MKNLFFITLMLIPFLGISQTTKPVDSFLGIKFGSSKEAVMAAMKAKGATFDIKDSDPNFLLFDNVKLGHRAAYFFIVRLIDNKAYEAEFNFKVEFEAKTIDEYNSLVSDVNEVYGPGKTTKRFKSPYKEGDGDEVLALTTGNATYRTFWSTDKSENSNSISATINYTDSEMSLELLYQDGTLINKVIEKQKAKEKKDF